MAALPNYGSIKQGKRKLRLTVDQFVDIGRGYPIFSVVDVESGDAIAGVSSVMVKPEEGAAYVELRIANIKYISARAEEGQEREQPT